MTGNVRRAGFRRRIAVVPHDGGVSVGLEDDFHRFTLRLGVSRGRFSAVEGTAERTPWRVCPGALDYLAADLQGRLVEEVASRSPSGDHCTHLFDMAALAAAHALDAQAVVFDMTVGDPSGDIRSAQLTKNGRRILEWRLRGRIIDGPAPFEGCDLQDVRRRAVALPAESAEQALLLRRACFVANGRQLKTDMIDDLETYRRKRQGVCFTYSGDRLQETTRRVGWRKDFSRCPDRLLKSWTAAGE